MDNTISKVLKQNLRKCFDFLRGWIDTATAAPLSCSQRLVFCMIFMEPVTSSLRMHRGQAEQNAMKHLAVQIIPEVVAVRFVAIQRCSCISMKWLAIQSLAMSLITDTNKQNIT